MVESKNLTEIISYLTYASKHNSNREKQVILLMEKDSIILQ